MKIFKFTFKILCCCFISTTLSGQDWLWVKNISCTNTAQVMGMRMDKTGNFIQTLYFQDNLTLSGKSLTSKGNSDIVIAKYKPDGDTIWVKTSGSTGLDIPRDIFISTNNEILLTGGFSNTIYFDNKQLTNTFSSEDIFLTKYASDGTVLWAKNVAWGPGQNRSSGITMDADGNIYMIGFFADKIYFDSDTLTSNGVVNNFFAKYDKDGNFIKAILYPGTNANSRLNEISLGTDNSLLISGFYYNSITINNQTHTSKGSGDLALLKTDLGGELIWLRTAGGTTDDRAVSATSDNYGNVYFTGYVSNNPTFDSTDTDLRNSSVLKTKGNIDIFAAKYNKNGTLQWKVANGSTGVDQGMGISIYNKIVQFTGSFSGEVIFKEDTLKSNSTSDEDPGIFMYNADGAPIKGISVKGTGTAIDQGRAAIYDNKGNVYLNGTFFSDALSFGDFTITKTASGIKNSFLAKYQLPLSVAFTEVQNVTCNGLSNGELIATPYFGAPPFTYSWSHDSNLHDSTAASLPAGTYTVTVTDARSQTTVSSYTITQPASISIASTQSNVNCHPDNGTADNGIVNITVTGGASPYGYSWVAESGSGTNPGAEDQTTLTKGTYKVTVTDNNLCEASKTYTIDEPDKITFGNSVVTDATSGFSNGAVNLSVAGGNNPPAYTSYSWSNGATTEDISGVPGGNYTITVKDTKLCQGDTTFLVNDTTYLQVTLSDVTNVDCKGSSTGSATVAVSNFTGTVTYEWKNVYNAVVGNSAVLSDIIAGKYTVVVKDNLDTAFTIVTITEPDEILSSSISGLNPECYGASTGYVNFSVSGGSLPYRFLWSNGAKTEDIVNIPAGNYSVTVTDTNGCTSTKDYTVDEPDGMFITFTIDQRILCHGDQVGRVTANITGGSGPWTYLWDDPGNQTESTATSLFGGSYNVVVTDHNGCQINENVTLSEPDSITLNSVVQSPSCLGDSDGSIVLNVSGGTPTYDYVWSNGDFTRIITDLSAGDYSVTVTDENLCSTQHTITLSPPADVRFSSIALTSPTCFGLDDGQINMTGQGGAGAYQYSVNGSAFSSDSILSVTGGNYILIMRDCNNCKSPDSLVSISQPVKINFSNIALTTSSCVDTNDASVLITPDGGAGGPYQFSVDGSAFSSDSLFINLETGSHILVISDVNNCMSSDSVINIASPAPVVFQGIILSSPSCIGLSDAEIMIISNGATAPYQFSINGGTSYSNDSLFTGLSVQSYHLKIKNANNCESADSLVAITDPVSSSITSETATDVSCNGSIDGSIVIIVSGTASNFEYSVDNGASYLANIGEFTNLSAGSYQVRIRDLNNCEQSGSSLTINQPDSVTIDTSSVTHANGDVNGSINTIAEGGTSPFTYVLDQTSTDSITNTTGQFTDLIPGNYIAYALDNNSCKSDLINITILQSSSELEIFDAFSPNGDKVNDEWNIINIGRYPNCKVNIYNTWGNEVFSSKGYSEPWDGKYNDKYLPAGTYYYIIDLGDGSDIHSGPVSIVR